MSPLNRFFFLVLSWGIVAFGQPAWSSLLGVAAAAIGYALFWHVFLAVPHRTPSSRFCTAALWFAAVQAVQLSWMATDDYFDMVIYFVWGGLAIAMGLQFALVSLLLPKRASLTSEVPTLSWGHILMVAALWVFMEWSRLFLLTGFPWDPAGMALGSTTLGMQAASLGGVYLLSLWVFFTNLCAVWAWQKRCLRRCVLWLLIAAAPYLFGLAQEARYSESIANAERMTALLVQTKNSPNDLQKFATWSARQHYWTYRWDEVIQLLAPYHAQRFDLVLFPETIFPFGPDTPLYYTQDVQAVLNLWFPGAISLRRCPGRVGNAVWAQELANALDAEVVIGLEASWEDSSCRNQFYNAALHFVPHQAEYSRYAKRVLVPMGEYIPYEWCKPILEEYGIRDSFVAGEVAGVFHGKRPLGVSICMEEIYGSLMRESRQAGASVLLNLSNDAWFPRSKLGWQHFYHARIRTVENGIPLARACNNGVTGVCDSLGRTVALWDDSALMPGETTAVRAVAVPMYQYNTLYSIVGDRLVLWASAVLFLFCVLRRGCNTSTKTHFS